MSKARKIAKNTLFLLVSQIISYILAFFYMIYIARYLGADGFGTLSFAIAFTGIFSVLADLGLNTLTVREIARDKSLTGKYFSNVVLMKIVLAVLTFGLMAVIINLLGYPQEVINVVYFVALYSILTAFYGIFNSIFQAYEEIEYQSIGQVISNVLMFAGVLIGIHYALNVLGFAFIFFISSVISLIYISLVYIWKFPPYKMQINWSFWKSTIKEALPFGLTGISGMVYTYIDSVMLSLFQGNEVVGWYNAAYRLILALLYIPITINITLFPSMSQFHISSKDSLNLITEKYFKLMVITGIPLGAGVTILADNIIILIFGYGYLQSIIVLQILIWTTVFTFIGAAFVRLLEATNRQLIVTKISAICVVVNILLNLILIPKFSYVGASISTVVTEIVLVGSIIKIGYKFGFGIPTKTIKEILLKVIVSTMVMSLLIIYFKVLNLLILVPFAILAYFIVLYLIKGIDDVDRYLFKQIIKRR
jgi:O-antigen/teichoic acid export membrane protein